MALAVSSLCIVGMYQFLGISGDLSGGSDSRKTNETLNYLLLPYLVLTMAILLSQLLLFASKIIAHEKSEVIAERTGSHPKKPKNTAVKSKPGRPKKAQSKSAPVPPKSGGKGKSE